jgi:hypothetical protein
MAPAAVNILPFHLSQLVSVTGGSQQRVDGQQVAGTHTITRKIVLAPRGHADADADATALNSGVRIGETLPLRHMDDVVAEDPSSSSPSGTQSSIPSSIQAVFS